MDIPGYRVNGLIFQSVRSALYRGRSAGDVAVIIKTPASKIPTTREIARYQWAFDQAREADQRAVVPHLELVRLGASVALVTEDFGGASLAGLVRPGGLALGRLLDLALALTTAVGRLHISGIVHKDIKPANIIVRPDSSDLRLVDLDISTNLRREVVDAVSLDQIEGTLAYMSPEQCGRVDSLVDNRSDLYSLGVTLFELATGRLPFLYDDAAELAHAHVARPPPTLRELRPELPAILSDILGRLLAKNADDRYASAQGLAHDLGLCLSDLRRTGTVRAFALGSADAISDLRVPDRLYGREGDRDYLLAAFDGACQGKRAFVTVAGVSGIGKTALVNEARRAIALTQGRVCAGKYDQFRPDLPYLGILQAITGLLRLELAEPEAQLAPRRAALREALGSHARLLTDVLPDLVGLIGEQPEVESVPPRDAERRLHLIVGRLLAVFAVTGRPVVMFLDDLQWADPPSLQLLEALAADPGLSHLMVIAGFRSNEVGPGHPLRTTLAALRTAADATVDIALGPLQPADVQRLLADTLHAEPGDVQSLGVYVYTVSGGNPFAVREYLQALRVRGFFKFDEEKCAWTWDLDRVRDYALPDNVAALIAQRLDGLSPQCLDLLDTASCVGGEFDLHTIASVHAMTASAAAVGLAAAVRSGIIVPLDSRYKEFESLDGWDAPETALKQLGTARYRFQHDQVRLTVHDRLDGPSRALRHLQIGRLLLQNLSPGELEHRVVEVFSHVVFGIDLVLDADERHRLSRVGLAAGHSALRALAFASARKLLLAARQLLAPSAWSDDYDTAMGIHIALTECAHALMLVDEFETMSELVIHNARTVVQSAHAHRLQIRLRTVQNRYGEAVDVGVRVAASLGVALPRKPSLIHVLWGVVKTLWAQRGRDPLEFENLPAATNPQIQAAILLLSNSAGAAYFGEPNLLPLIGMTCTRLSLKHGMTPQSPYTFAVWALVLCGVLGRIENGYRFGQLALSVGRRYGGADEARARFVVDTFIAHWKEPLADVARQLYADWANNRDSGDEEDATYCAGVLGYTYFFAGSALDLNERHGDSSRYLVDCGQSHVKYCHLAWVELFAALSKPEMPAELDGEWFQYPRRLPEFKLANNGVQIAISSVAAGILDHLAGRFDRAEERFALAASHEDGFVGQVIVPGLAFFRALNTYRRVGAGSASKAELRMARRMRRRLERWAVHAPFNLDHRVLLLRAEEALLQGKSADAILMLHRAFEAATGASVLYQALAQQALARALGEAGMRSQSSAAALLASGRFRSWGSPWLASAAEEADALSRKASRESTTDLGGSTHMNQLEGADFQSMLNAVAAMSGEIDEAALLARLMSTVMQVAGADRGLLLLIDATGEAAIEVEASLEQTLGKRTALDAFSAISRRVVNLALRSTDPVVVHDATASDMLQGEAYIRENGVAAILAVSIALQGRTIGVLYLENHVSRSPFTAGRIQITRALGAQAAIALENARLYSSVQTALKEQTALTEANRRFVPGGFLTSLGRASIVDVKLNEAIEHEMNVLFVDLRGFSTLSAKLGPRGTIELINRYLSHVQPGIAAYGGFVGQYYGDGILALFPKEPEDAVRGAIAMCRGLEAYNRDRGPDFPALRFGMGLHSGPVILGTIGDPDHFQCSVVGDSVNLASRLESLTKHFSAMLVLDAATRDRIAASDQFGMRPLGSVIVKGRAEGMDVYECVACYSESLQDRIMANHDAYCEGLAAYRAGAWDQALASFEFCLERCEQDRVVHSFAQRCRDRRLSSMAWDGIERPAKT
jgi:predicted ATPase/class 3 adenylate cyclase